MDLQDILVVLAILVIVGVIWGLPKETIYNALVTIIAALIAAGWFVRKRRRRE